MLRYGRLLFMNKKCVDKIKSLKSCNNVVNHCSVWNNCCKSFLTKIYFKNYNEEARGSTFNTNTARILQSIHLK